NGERASRGKSVGGTRFPLAHGCRMESGGRFVSRIRSDPGGQRQEDRKSLSLGSRISSTRRKRKLFKRKGRWVRADRRLYGRRRVPGQGGQLHRQSARNPLCGDGGRVLTLR